MDKKIIDRARKEAELYKGKTAEFYLCYVESAGTSVGDRAAKKYKYWGVFAEEQHGYQAAEERIPLYPEERVVTETFDWWREG